MKKFGSILDRDDAMTILSEAADRLAAIGVFARVEPTALPDDRYGLGVILIAGCEVEAVARLHVQSEIGVMVANSADNYQFEQRVSCALKDTVFRAATFGVELTDVEQRDLKELSSSAT